MIDVTNDKEVIDQLEFLKNRLHEDDSIAALDRAINQIKNEQWIDVNDRLPKNYNNYFRLSEDVLICNADGEMFVAYYNFRKECWQNDYKRFTWSDHIVKWRPLPRSYEEDYVERR